MVLHAQVCGRVGRRPINSKNAPDSTPGRFAFWPRYRALIVTFSGARLAPASRSSGRESCPPRETQLELERKRLSIDERLGRLVETHEALTQSQKIVAPMLDARAIPLRYTTNQMNIDERLDRLTERHEALTQTVEILVHMHRETEEALRQNEEAHRQNEEAHRKNEEAHAKNQVLITQVLESINSLARIAHAHEQRISDLEDGRQ